MIVTCDTSPRDGSTALVLLGGGARVAYQVGFLRGVARRLPEVRFPILAGTSAGAINVAHLASRTGSMTDATEELAELWRSLTPDSVMRVDATSLAKNVVLWGTRLLSGGLSWVPDARSLVDCAPLESLLRSHLGDSDGRVRGIAENVHAGRVRSVALTTTCYSTSDSVTFVHGRELPDSWSRPGRLGIGSALTVDHVLASGALPFVFPAVKIGGHWHGDGGIRLSSPLSPAIGLGADRIVALSTHSRTAALPRGEAEDAEYPPPAEVVGTLFRSHFHDRLASDVRRLRRLNGLLEGEGASAGSGLRRVEAFVVRPSEDPGALAREYETRLPRAFRFMTRGLGTLNVRSPDLLSMLLFEPAYLRRLVELGECDARKRGEELEAFLRGGSEATGDG